MHLGRVVPPQIWRAERSGQGGDSLGGIACEVTKIPKDFLEGVRLGRGRSSERSRELSGIQTVGVPSEVIGCRLLHGAREAAAWITSDRLKWWHETEVRSG